MEGMRFAAARSAICHNQTAFAVQKGDDGRIRSFSVKFLRRHLHGDSE